MGDWHYARPLWSTHSVEVTSFGLPATVCGTPVPVHAAATRSQAETALVVASVHWIHCQSPRVFISWSRMAALLEFVH